MQRNVAQFMKSNENDLQIRLEFFYTYYANKCDYKFAMKSMHVSRGSLALLCPVCLMQILLLIRAESFE